MSESARDASPAVDAEPRNQTTGRSIDPSAADPSAPEDGAAEGADGLIVVLFPDPVLRRETRPVEAFDPELRRTAEAMLARMYASRGVGLAAPQVGRSLRMFVLNPEGDAEHADQSRVLVNPTITARAGKRVKHEEGCLSLPHIFAEVERPERCTVEFQDLEGARHVEEFDGFVSRIVQHEYDHLEGVLIVDRMTPADKARHRAALDELRAQYREQQDREKQAR